MATEHEQDRPASVAAEVHILFNGYLGEHTASTVGFVRDGAARVIIDPGMVPNRHAILGPLAALNESGGSITDGMAPPPRGQRERDAR